MIVATAGHVDHGKSSLVRAICGTDPDRWAEEKRRGLTIDLGFATAVVGERGIEFVDVPGHQRFVTNMLTGAGSADAVLLAVSAVEGWMPQTEEHLQIFQLLGANQGVVALTFADRVLDQRLEEVTTEVRAKLVGSFLDSAPVVATSVNDESSIGRLERTIGEVLSEQTERRSMLGADRPRLWVDRSFTVEGAGTVVTGTLTHGSFSVGDEVELRSRNEVSSARIRSMQVFGADAASAGPQQRVGMNLAGLQFEPQRGDAVCRAGQWQPARRISVALMLARGIDRPPRSRGAYHAHIGTAHGPARLVVIEPVGAESGPFREAWFAQLLLAESVATVATGDRVVIRDESIDATIAGGVVVGSGEKRTADQLDALRRRVAALCEPDPISALRLELLAEHGGALDRDELAALVGHAAGPGAVEIAGVVASSESLATAARELTSRALAGENPELPSGPLGVALEATVRADDQVEVRGGVVVSAESGGHSAELRDALNRLEALVAENEPPRVSIATAAEAGVGSRLIKDLETLGEVVVVERWTMLAADEARLRERVVARLTDDAATASELRQALGLPRSVAIPYLEWLDALGVTQRRDDERVLARR